MGQTIKLKNPKKKKRESKNICHHDEERHKKATIHNASVGVITLFYSFICSKASEANIPRVNCSKSTSETLFAPLCKYTASTFHHDQEEESSK
jgi:hypothetical protein